MIQIQFVDDASELARDIISSSFFSPERMTPANLFARGGWRSAEAYAAHYASRVRPFEQRDRETLRRVVAMADGILAVFPRQLLRRRVPWRFARLGDGLEMNYPHTIGTAIMLSDQFLRRGEGDRSLAETLIHEKVHVYQRMFPERAADLIERIYRFSRTDDRAALPPPLMRNNPDTDGRLYRSPQGQLVYMAFNGARPKSIADCSITTTAATRRDAAWNPSMDEHPYERMAYEIASVAMRQQCLVNSPLYAWMVENL